MSRTRIARRLATTAVGLTALVCTGLGTAAGASTTVIVGSGSGSTSPAPQMSVTCTTIALKFNYGAYLMNKEGATPIDKANGQNLEKIALDDWYRVGCDQYGLMPIW